MVSLNGSIMNKTDVLVIGGGPAGMMAAITAAQQGAQVLLIERMDRLGRKLNITGKGRCNVTNNASQEELMRNVVHNGRFLFSAFSRFDAQDTMAFFEKLGVPLKIERGNRVFPVSDSAFDISGALQRQLRHSGVNVLQDRIQSLLVKDEILLGTVGEKGKYLSKNIVIATGGISYPATGSSGDGYQLARQAGHTIVAPRASLVPLTSPDSDCEKMQGLTLKNVAIKVKDPCGKIICEDFGEMLFTHFGLSGPMILSASARLDWKAEYYSVEIDLKPALDESALDARLLRDLEQQNNRDFVNVLSGLLPHSMIDVMVHRTKIPPQTKANAVTRGQRHELLRQLKCFTVQVNGTRPVEEAIVTQGGVSVKEIVPGTMQSKCLPGLYFAGEVMDVDALTGGFNLQIAWATGYLAGKSAAEAAIGEEKR